jgi:hypothetical protein
MRKNTALSNASGPTAIGRREVLVLAGSGALTLAGVGRVFAQTRK